MGLYEVVLMDGTREKIGAYESLHREGALLLYDCNGAAVKRFHKGEWLEVWRREEVSG